ncbi:MAG: hypothetical protein CEO12_238 [Parcubacteria group bacterium Gr01-1014_46]|nr:MAG: hypothetical protein CEO12_238 [Parcubacteria group bacterium Gr01-1014_46]
MAKYSRAKRTEKQEIGVLETLLNAHPLLTQLTKGDDDFPLIDGYVHLLGEQDEVGGNMLKVQIKPLKTNKDGSLSATCSTDLLSHAHGSSIPVFLIAVNPDEQVAYWMYLAPESVKTQYEAQVSAGKKTITFRLNKNHTIKKGAAAYVAEWKRICGHHRNTSNDRLALRYKKRVRKNLITANEDTLLERIRTLHDLVYYRTNKGEFPLVEIVLDMARTIGGTSALVKIAYIELLEQVIHDKTAEALEVITKLASDESEQVRKKAAEALKNTTKYNYHWLNAIGYGPYRAMLDFITSHDVPSEIAHEMLRNLFSPDFDGTSQTDMYTLTFHRGALDATKFLKKLRRDAIDLLTKRYEIADTIREKSKTVDTIGYATHKTDWPTGDPDFLQRSVDMVEADTEHVVAAYKKILFPKSKMIADYPVVYEIETQLSILNTRERKISGVEELLQQIRENKGDYRLFSLLAGDEMRLRRDMEWQEGRQQKEEELKEVLESITEKNAEEWYARINAVANFRDCVEDWLYQTLRDFLAQIAEKKPKVAAVFAKHALTSKTGLYFFFRGILWGLRKGSLDQWDEYVDYIAKHHLTDQIDGILMSYFSVGGTELSVAKIRKEDIAITLEIARKVGRFAFLKSDEINRALEYHSIRSLAFLSTLDKDIRKALIEKIKEYPELDTMYPHELGFALHCKWIKLEEWDRTDLETLAEMLVNIKRLDHNELQVLHALGVVDFNLMMLVFERRIKHSYDSGYDAIPYHIEPGVAAFIRDDPRTKDVVRRWLEERDPEQDSMIGYHLGEFFNRVGGDVLRGALSDLIATGKKENILKVMEMLPISDPADPSLCLEIVAVTDDRQILARVDARMRQTGGGTGAVGENIFAREMRKNQARIEDVKSKSTNPKIIKFCEKVLANLAKDIARSEQEHEREMREERQEYEDEHPKD